MAKPSKKEERERREAEWLAEQERVRLLGCLTEALPAGEPKRAMLTGMRDRIIDLYNASRFEHGDVLLEFMPNDYARKLLDWYFPDDDAETSLSPEAPAIEDEDTQPGQVQGEPQQPSGSDGYDPGQANAEIVAVARDLVALWENPNIKGLPRAERNAAIEDTRRKLIAAVLHG